MPRDTEQQLHVWTADVEGFPSMQAIKIGVRHQTLTIIVDRDAPRWWVRWRIKRLKARAMKVDRRNRHSWEDLANAD